MSVPVERLGRLSLQDMPTMTQLNVKTALSIPRSHPRDMTETDNEPHREHDTSKRHDDNAEQDAGEEGHSEDDDQGVIQSPTSLYYSLEQLPAQSRAAVRDVFQEPPKIALQRCRRIGDTYAFQMTEVVTRSVRIRAPRDAEDKEGKTSPYPTCSCGRSGINAPCPHLIWLLDQLLNQTMYEHDKSKPLQMTRAGYAREMGDPFQNINDFDLNILADGLHCPVVDPEAAYASSDEDDEVEEEIDYHRVLEARELLAGVYSMPPEEFRPDIFDMPSRGPPVLKDKDLDGTVFRMLLDNHQFFQYFLSLARPADPINDLFRKLSQRVDRVLRDLDASSQPAPSLPVAESDAEKTATETEQGQKNKIQHPKNSQVSISLEDNPQHTDGRPHRDVAWAAKHLTGIVKLIRSAIYTRDEPLRPKEAISAARTLVHILASVAARDVNTKNPSKPDKPESNGSGRAARNLYLRLIGDRDIDFVLAELNLLPEAASHLVDSIEAILEQISVHGAPPSYVDRFRKLITRLRSSSAGTGLKRHVRTQEEERQRGAKRMK